MIGVTLKIACVLHVDGNLGADITVPAVHALHDADVAQDISIVKRVKVGLEHACNSEVPHLDLVVDKVGHDLVAGMEFKPVSNDLGDGDTVSLGSITGHGGLASNHTRLQVAPVITVVNTTHDDAHEVLVGLENGAFVRYQTDALHLGLEFIVLRDGFTHLTPVERGIVLVNAECSVRDPQVGIQVHDLT